MSQILFSDILIHLLPCDICMCNKNSLEQRLFIPLNKSHLPRTSQQTVNQWTKVGGSGERRMWEVRFKGVYFWTGMRSSMAWPFSSRFSISISSLTPSTNICTSSTSEKPKRSALEMSKTPPTAAVSTPPNEQRHHYLLISISALYFGSWHSVLCCLNVLQLKSVWFLPVPRFCSLSLLRTSSNWRYLLRLGSLTCTPARSPVPRLDGQVRT